MSSAYPSLAQYESLMVFVTMLLVGALAWKAWKESGLHLSLSQEGYGASMRINNAAVRSELGSDDRRDGMGNLEFPVFWNAGSFKAVYDNQASMYDSTANGNVWNGNSDDGSNAEGFRGRASYAGRKEGATVNGQVLSPF